MKSSEPRSTWPALSSANARLLVVRPISKGSVLQLQPKVLLEIRQSFEVVHAHPRQTHRVQRVRFHSGEPEFLRHREGNAADT